MPPRKSTDSTTAKGADGEGAASGSGRGRGQRHSDGLGVEDLSLPRSMVQRLAKGMLPANTSIQKDALLAMSKSATVFVNYLASNANDRAVLKNKRTIQPSDVFDALDELEFPDFLPRVKTELEIWNTAQCDKRNSYRRRIKEEAAAKDGSDPNGTAADGTTTNGVHRDGEEPPASKKARLSSGAAVDEDEDMMDEPGEGDDETIDDNEGEDEDDDNAEEDEDMDDDPAAGETQENGLEGDMDHNQRDGDDDDGNESE